MAEQKHLNNMLSTYARKSVGWQISWVRLAVWLLGAAGGRASGAGELSYTSVQIPMRDTNVLAADVWFAPPLSAAKPVILIQTPYNKNYYRLGMVPGYAGAGFPVSTNYNYVIVDWRGFYGSAGAAVPGYDRGLDGYDCVEWIAKQSWANGRVGTCGSSALGLIQYQAAFKHPPHLVCCDIRVKDFQTRYDNYYYGGDYRKEHVESLAALGLADTAVILAHPDYDLLWQALEKSTDTPEQMQVPTLVVGGWFDHFPDTVLRSFADLRQQSAAAVRDRHRLIFGPWLHDQVGQAQQGVLNFPNATNLAPVEIAFWDYMLRDLTNDAWARQPVMTYYQMGENIWLEATNWADIPRLNRTLYLRAGGLLLSDSPVAGESPEAYAYDPNDPTPAFGGSRFNPFDPNLPEGPQDESTNIETRADVRIFTTPVLTNDLRLNGSLLLTLQAASDRTDTDFAVRLTDVYPDGRSIIMTQAIQRGRFRNSLSMEQLMTPGTVYPIKVQLENLALTFRTGHRLRLVVSSAIYPQYDRNYNDGGPMYGSGTPLVATNRIYHDSLHVSRLDFQVLPDDTDGDGLPDVWEADNFGGLQRDGTGDFDGDGFSDRSEYLAGTQPSNAASALRIESFHRLASGELDLAWQSVGQRRYDLLMATGSLATAFSPLATNIVATPPTNSVRLTPPPGVAAYYRVQAHP